MCVLYAIIKNLMMMIEEEVEEKMSRFELLFSVLFFMKENRFFAAENG